MARAGVALFEIEQELLDLAAVRLAGVGTLRHVDGEIGEVGVERDLLLGDVSEGLRARDELGSGGAFGEGAEARVEVFRHLGDVAFEEIHHRGLGLVVEVVAREELVGSIGVGVLGEQLAPEDPTVRAGGQVLGVLLDNAIHFEVELLGVGNDLVGDVGSLGERARGVEALVAVALDSLVDRERDEFDPRVGGERLREDRAEHDAVLAPGETKQPRLGVFRGGVVADETVLADPSADPLFDRRAKVTFAEMRARVRRV